MFVPLSQGRDALYLSIISLQELFPSQPINVILQSYTCYAVLQPLVSLEVSIVVLSPDDHSFSPSPNAYLDAISPDSINILIIQETFSIPYALDSLDSLPDNCFIVLDRCHTTPFLSLEDPPTNPDFQFLLI